MDNHCLVMLATLFCGLYLIGNAAVLPAAFPNYQVAVKVTNKEIHLKHGKLHLHDDYDKAEDDEHLVYRYRWLGDDIVKTEEHFDDEDGDDDNQYDDQEKKVKLPGGCEITEDQYLELESFKKETQYVKKCYCEQGGVYCQLNKALFKEKLL